ncbi:MAG: hypothetical protein HOC28_08495 [Bacteroidetes Order II. Incertae sedis bacterium]|jgi:hypothetical protein|nr:hypothetical protein [Bacteroidetes Order II. bacterium]HAY35892.1 hypothetical protein [Bacteroidota bacterium]MBT4603164.1 hypothetical protein [Bacteroidetes Order II. bacterium]MBT5249794.1 hypothetical protein [Bacteroidetes Order II. bacterium]MBT6201696.1 hypothetical protein [Bacteroidetes Order II. bacterium]
MIVKKVARWAWLIPAILVALSAHQAYTAIQLQKTMDEGISTWAEVTRYDRSDRKDVTHVELDLIVHLPDGTEFERKNLTLPYSIGHRVQADTLQVKVLQGAAQEVVIEQISSTHVRIAWSNFVMSFIGFLMAFGLVFGWNRMLKRSESA